MNAHGIPLGRATHLALTPAGRLMVLLSVCAHFATTAVGLRLPLLPLAVGALALAALLAWWQIHTVALGRVRSARMVVGARFELEVELQGARGPLRFQLSERATRLPTVAGFLMAVPPHPTSAVRLAWRLKRRGRHAALTAWVDSVHPLGWVRARRRCELACDLVGLPRRGRLAPELARADARDLVTRGRTVRGDEELVAVRDWRPGESLRRVHWRLSARRGRAIVRELAAPTAGDVELELHHVLDTTTRRALASFERAVSLTATLAEHHLRAGRRLTLVVGGEVRARGLHGRGGLARALALLAEVDALSFAELYLPLPHLPRSAPGCVFVCVGPGGPARAPSGARVLDVDAPPGHPHHAHWREPDQEGAGR